MRRYPGLYKNSRDGIFYIRHPVTRKAGSLKTKDPNTAVRLWAMVQERWEQERSDFDSDQVAQRLSQMPRSGRTAHTILLRDYLREWRQNVLGHRLESGRVKWGECHVLSRRGRNRGKPIAMPTRKDYANDVQQLEASPDSRFAIGDPMALRKVRRLLSPWMTTPTHYNGLRNTLSRVFDHAVSEGLVDSNPIREVSKLTEARREVLIPDEAYKAITDELCKHKLNRQTFDGTWRAKICDMVYMMSQQPIDVFGLEEEQIDDDAGAHGEIHFARHKTGVGIVLEMNQDLRGLVDWFREFKREQQIVSPYLMVYPRYFDVRSRGKPVKHRYMSIAWAAACEAAGYKGQYHLRDLRKKGLTNEFLAQGENNKGGHQTEAMRKHYRLITPPERSKSTLEYINKESS